MKGCGCKLLFGKEVIGIDETNHFTFMRGNLTKKDFPMIVGGYLVRNYSGTRNGTQAFEKKKGAYSENMEFEDFLRRSKGYFSLNPDFFYTTISRNDMIKSTSTEFANLRARAINSLVVSFISNYRLNPRNIGILIDDMQTKDFVEDVKFRVNYFMKRTFGLNPVIISKIHADEHYSPARKAEAGAYYIAGLRLKNGRNVWPFRDRKVDNRRLELLASKYEERDLILDSQFEESFRFN